MADRSDVPFDGRGTDSGRGGPYRSGPDRGGRRAPPANVLVRTTGPSAAPLPPLSDPDRTSVLAVTCTGQPAAHARRWRERDGALPADLGVLAVGRQAGGSVPRADGDWTRGDGYAVAAVAHPGDLTGIEIAVTAFLDRLPAGSRRVVLVDSLTVLLQYAGPGRAFGFLDALTGHLREAGALAYFHVTAGAHDEGTVAGLRTLFDAEVDRSGASREMPRP